MDTTHPKPWWTSRAMIGGLLALAVGVMQTLGVIVGAEDQASILDTLVAVADSAAVALAGVLALWGRYQATRPIAPGIAPPITGSAPLIALLLLATLSGGGCASAEQVEALRASIDQTRAELRERPTTPQTAAATQTLDRAEQVVQRLPVAAAAGGGGLAQAGAAIQAAAPAAGQFSPWLMLAGGLLIGLGGGAAVKRASEKAFDEGAQRGAAGEIKPIEAKQTGT